jgi:membrane protease YdiL (CAAX protease family)
LKITRQLLIFFSIAFAFTWAVGAWMIFGHLRIEFGILASCGPTIAALVTNRLAYGHYRAFRFGGDWRRLFGAGALGLLMVLASEIIFPAIATVDVDKLRWGVFVSASAYNYSTLLGGPLFEEPGWRGFALPRLESWCGPVPASLLLGTLWATWHLPFFFYPGWSECPIGIYFLISIGLSTLITLAANLARFAVIVPILMHAAHNSSGKFFAGLFSEASPGSGGLLPALAKVLPLSGDISLSFFSLIAIGSCGAAIFVVLLSKGRLAFPTSYDPEAEPRELCAAKPAHDSC